MTETQQSGIARMGSIVLDVPDPAASARFWNTVTGGETTSTDETWVTTRTGDGWRLNFQRTPDLVRAEWPGQEHPQQLHLDIRTTDVGQAARAAVAQGATILAEEERWTTLADPSGHTFDLCAADAGPAVSDVMFDVPDAHAAVHFWSALIGEPVTYDQDGMGMVGGDRPITFQQVENYTPPAWPDPARPQQGHIDVYVEDLDAAERATLALGATRLHHPEETGEEDFRVFADPAGHPFCLCQDYS